MEIYCCKCEKKVEALLIDGSKAYPHREDLYSLPFWECPECCNFVGCHHKTKNRTQPLGCIPTKEIKSARIHIHKILDPLYKSGRINRRELYEIISDKIGWKYHTAKIRSIEEARQIYTIVRNIYRKLED